MFGPRGNPQARNLFGIIGYLQKQAGVEAPRQAGAGVIWDHVMDLSRNNHHGRELRTL